MRISILRCCNSKWRRFEGCTQVNGKEARGFASPLKKGWSYNFAHDQENKERVKTCIGFKQQPHRYDVITKFKIWLGLWLALALGLGLGC